MEPPEPPKRSRPPRGCRSGSRMPRPRCRRPRTSAPRTPRASRRCSSRRRVTTKQRRCSQRRAAKPRRTPTRPGSPDRDRLRRRRHRARRRQARARPARGRAGADGTCLPASIRARAWLVEVRLARASGRGAPPYAFEDAEETQEGPARFHERIDLPAEVSLERVRIASAARVRDASAHGYVIRAQELAQVAASPRLIALVELEAGAIAAQAGDAYGSRACSGRSTRSASPGFIAMWSGLRSLVDATRVATPEQAIAHARAALDADGDLAQPLRALIDVATTALDSAIARALLHGQERSASHRLAVTLDAIRDGVVSCDEHGVVISANAALERMLGSVTARSSGSAWTRCRPWFRCGPCSR